MNDQEFSRRPEGFEAIRKETEKIGFAMASDPLTGALLAALAASKARGRFLELGTGTGLGAAWILAGMDADARLDTVDIDPETTAVAQRRLGADSRVTFHLLDGAEFLAQSADRRFDLIFADAWPGKFTHLEQALALLSVGGVYVIDDLSPQLGWPEDHAQKVSCLIETLESLRDFTTVRMSWATGLMLAVRRGGSPSGCIGG